MGLCRVPWTCPAGQLRYQPRYNHAITARIASMSLLVISHRELAETLSRMQAGINASELHGSLTGYLCAGGRARAEGWTDALALDLGASAGDDVFTELHRYCRSQIDDVDLGFEPLLPNDDVSLKLRAEALVDWCRGFLGGIGLAGGSSLGAGLSEDAGEIIRDFSTIAASHFDYSDTEEDERALVEVLEFVRVGVLLLYSELGPEPPLKNAFAPGSERVH